MSLVWATHRAVVRLVAPLPLFLAVRLLKAYCRALSTARREYVATTYFGARIGCDPRDLVQRTILLFGVWEPDVSHVIEHRLKAGEVFVDVGANVGYHTLLAAQRVGPTGRVVAVEPAPRTFELLRRNLQRNQVRNVRLVNAAIADRAGTVDLRQVDERNIGAATTVASRGGTTIASVDRRPLDAVLEADEVRRVRLIKIDVEGAEPPILRRFVEQLDRYPDTVELIVEASPEDDRGAWLDVFQGLSAAGFAVFEIANRYSLGWYLRWRAPSPPRRIEALPSSQRDLLFTRLSTNTARQARVSRSAAAAVRSPRLG